jgi:Protein of unknown function (DUF2442)
MAKNTVRAPQPLGGADIDTQVSAAAAQASAERAAGLRATSARYDRPTRRVVMELVNGYSVGIPLQNLPQIADAPIAHLQQAEVIGAGSILHWEALDADYSVPALIIDALGRSFAVRELARVAGSAKSKAKTRAAKLNGAKGGRPKKQPARSVKAR